MTNIADLAAFRARAEGITEDSAALLFRDRHAGRLLHDHDVSAWFVWTGNQWRRERTNLAFDFARVLARDLSKEKDG